MSWRLFISAGLCALALANAQIGGLFTGPDISELSGEPSYRAVRLRWKSTKFSDANSFNVKVCEISVWNTKTRCRERHLRMNNDQFTHDVLSSPERGRFDAVINDLRMSTNYTFSVTPDLPAGEAIFYSNGFDVNAGPPRARNILLTTNGFTARAARCLSNTSEVVVNTGPYFNGKISVEETFDERCAVRGDRDSNATSYTLLIMHDLCGSKTVNNSRIETNIIVHENSDIVTHNSKRFMVVCNFLPETFTIKATVSMPKRAKVKSSEETNENVHPLHRAMQNDLFTYDSRQQQNHVRDSRILAEQNSKLAGLEKTDGRMFGQMSILILMVVGAVVGSGVAIWWFVHGSSRKSSDPTINMESCVTVTKSDKEELVPGEPSEHSTLRVNVCGRPVAIMSIKPIGDSEA